MRVLYVAKLVNGCFVGYLTEEKEREKEFGAIPEEGGETVVKENGVKEEKKKNKKKKKKNKKKNKKLDEKEENGEDVVMDEVEHENDEDVGEQEELDFWMPPDGERWDFDDGGDRWGSDSEEEEEKNGEEDPIGLFFTYVSHYYCSGIVYSCFKSQVVSFFFLFVTWEVGEMDEDGNSSLDDCILGEVDEDETLERYHEFSLIFYVY